MKTETRNRIGQTAEEWMEELFEFSGCDECGLEEDAHVPIMIIGNWFAMCDPSLPTGQIHLQDIRLKNNAGMDFPVCERNDEQGLDLVKTGWPMSGDFAEVTCPNCKREGPKLYSWAYTDPEITP